MKAPETRYIKSDDVHLAYQAVGDGPRDIVYLSSWDLAIDFLWDEPNQVQFFEHLASLGRLILFDKRGTGASDSVSLAAMPTLESWIDDVQAVMDALGSRRAAIVTTTFTGPLGILFAATCPNRTSSLVLIDTFARARIAPDYLCGMTDEEMGAALALVEQQWGTGDLLSLAYAPAFAGDERLRRWWNRCNRISLSPAAAVAFTAMMYESDVRNALPSIQAPALVLYRRQAASAPRSRYLAEHIPEAKHVVLEGADRLPWLGASVVEEIVEFLTGERPAVEIDRILTTILFTDIVGSTQRAASLGDQHWRSVLDAHDRAVREQLRRFRGHEINTTGDGFHASFDGPARAIRCARAIIDGVREHGIEVRAGLHTGECEIRGEDLAGLAVHIAARVGALAGTGEVLVSSTVKDLVVGSGIEFADRGAHELRGVPGTWRLFAAER